jgi:murein DD-endopeptidase MepM/ murein hydrolase activator NlpD
MPRNIYTPAGRHEWADPVPSYKAKTTEKKRKRRSPFAKFMRRLSKKLKLDKFAKKMRELADYFVLKALPENSAFSVKLKYSHLQHTSFLYRTGFIFSHVLKVVGLVLLGILKTVMPVVIPIAGVFVIGYSAWAASVYSVALEVKLGDEHVAFVQNQQEFDDIRASVEDRIYSAGETEYMMESIPTLSFVIIEKDEFTDSEKIAETLYNNFQEYIGQSYGFFFDGQLLGTSKNENDFSRLLEEVASWYLSGERNETYEILNNIEIVRDTYPKNYERSYSDLLSLFRTSSNPTIHKVSKNETAETIAEMYGISVPVLALLNDLSNTDSISSGDTLAVGKPFCELKVQTKYQVRYSEIIPFETKTTYTDSLYEGTTQVKQSGSNGVYEITAEVSEVNGVETYRNEISRKRVQDPVTRQILVGTKTIAPSGKFMWPLANHAGYLSSGFGWRTLNKQPNFHRGTDLAADKDTKIIAADAGTVVEVGFQKVGLGNYVVIDHGNGILSYYGHCNRIDSSVSKGKKVYKGQVIAYVGRTGTATGYHLHFALYNKETGEYFDAYPYISGN